MDPIMQARRQAGLDIQEVAVEFERSDEAAFARSRIFCWIACALATVAVLVLLVAGGDWRYLAAFWVVVAAVSWGGYWLSSQRQRQQTARLRALAIKWLEGAAPTGP